MSKTLTRVCGKCRARWLLPAGCPATICSDCGGKLRAPEPEDEYRPAFPLGLSLRDRMEMLRETRSTHPSFGARHAAAQEMLRLAKAKVD